MASSTRRAWVWVNSGSWWWTGRPDVLRFMGSQRVGHDWATELNWTEPFPSSEDLSKPGIKLESPELQADSLWSEPPGKPEDLGGPDLWLETKRLADQHHFRDIETLIPDKSFAESRDRNKMNKNVQGAYQGKVEKDNSFHHCQEFDPIPHWDLTSLCFLSFVCYMRKQNAVESDATCFIVRSLVTGTIKFEIPLLTANMLSASVTQWFSLWVNS